MERLQGQCHCGGVQVSVPGDAYGIVACHCGDCQRLHGNFFAMLVAPQDGVQWSGELAPTWVDSSPAAQRAHCPRCASRLAKRTREGGRVMVSAGLFGALPGRRIVRQVWTGSKPDWYDLPATAQP